MTSTALRLIGGGQLLLLVVPGMVWAQPASLPDIGSPAEKVYSLAEEEVLGQRVIHSLASQNALFEDALVNDYIQQLGFRLASGVFDELPLNRIFPQFSVIDYPAINAFAVPGGHIAIFTGLFAVSETEAELCSVIGHEIAHVRLRHYAQTLLKGRESTGISMLGIIAGILTTIANPLAGSAVLISTLAGSAQQSLKYSRQHEYEADVFGYQYLTNAGYDPKGMIDFHRRLLRLSSQNQQIEYLLTHPVSTNRIGEIASRISSDRANFPDIWMQPKRDDKIFHLIKARLLARKNVAQATSLKRQKKDSEVQNFYHAMQAMTKEKYSEARSILEDLLKKDPESAVYNFALAESWYAESNYQETLKTVDQLLTIYPRMTPTLLLGTDAALKLKNTEKAFRYLNKTKDLNLPHANHLRLLDYTAQIHYLNGDLVGHYLAKADGSFERGNYRDSFYYMRAAVNNRYIDAEKKARVQTLLDERMAFVEAGR